MAPVPNMLPAMERVSDRRRHAAEDDGEPARDEDEEESVTFDDIAPPRVDRATLLALGFDRSRLAWPPPDRITRRPEREYATFDDLAPPRVERASFGGPGFDWSPWYLTWEEDVGQNPLQQLIIGDLLPAVQILARRRAGGTAPATAAPPGEEAARRDWSKAAVASDVFFAWIPDEADLQVSPDVYVLDDPPVPVPSGRYETWRPGHHPPSFVVEVVSKDWRKDYEYNIGRYTTLGVREYIVADPDAFLGKTRSPEREAFVRYVNTGSGLTRRYAGPGPVYSAELDIWLFFTTTAEGEPRVRISHDEAGRDIVPTALEQAARTDAADARADAEAARADDATARADDATARADAEAARANTEAARANTEAARADDATARADAEAARAAALADELERLRAQLAKSSG